MPNFRPTPRMTLTLMRKLGLISRRNVPPHATLWVTGY